jgi:glycosyltransferase involved in cell wall biosynthesis
MALNHMGRRAGNIGMNIIDSSLRLQPSPKLDGDYVSGKVSVIIPTYNYANFLLDAIQSVFRQRVSDLEVIVVDDGSTDHTARILDTHRGRLKYIYQHNAGLSAARNVGMANSTGEFIQFLDADDMLGSNSLALQLQYLERHPEVNIVVCRNRLFQRTTGDGRPIPSGSWKLYHGNLDLHLCYFNIAPPHAFLSRRKAVVQTGWFDSRLKACEDYDFWLRAAVQGYIPHYNSAGLVYYRRHPKSMSANRVNQHLHDAVLHKRLSSLLNQHPQYPMGRRLEGLLAFSSGALVTAARLYAHEPKETNDLVHLACLGTEQAKKMAVADKNDWNILTKLYCLKMLHLLHRVRFRESTEVGYIYDNLFVILSSVKAPLSKLGLAGDALLSSVLGSWHYLGERRQLGRLSLKYFRSHILPT